MEEPPPSPLLSAACIVCTIGMFGSGLSDLRQMVATKSVENVQLLPFLTTHVNNLSWLGYGCMKGDRTLMAVNGIGAALQSLYIAVYCYYSPAKPAVLLRVAALLALLAAAVAAFAALGDRRSRTERLGLLSCAFTVGMYGCPLGAMVRAARSRSVRCLSLPLTVGTFMAAGCWTLSPTFRVCSPALCAFGSSGDTRSGRRGRCTPEGGAPPLDPPGRTDGAPIAPPAQTVTL